MARVSQARPSPHKGGQADQGQHPPFGNDRLGWSPRCGPARRARRVHGLDNPAIVSGTFEDLQVPGTASYHLTDVDRVVPCREQPLLNHR